MKRVKWCPECHQVLVPAPIYFEGVPGLQCTGKGCSVFLIPQSKAKTAPGPASTVGESTDGK